jgi:hypothetical protein
VGFAQLDARTRHAAVTGALLLAGQHYPNATISLTIDTGSGAPLISGTRTPGRAPTVQ